MSVFEKLVEDTMSMGRKTLDPEKKLHSDVF